MIQMQQCEIGRIESGEHQGISRVTAVVNGEPVWFESAEVQLQPSAEALASAFLVPAAHYGVPLRIHAPLSRLWQENVENILSVLHEWWDYPTFLKITADGESELPQRKPSTAQCFSGGVDSFYSLLRGRRQTQYLVCVHGYDMSYRDPLRMRKFRPSLDAVAEAVNRRAVVVRTNLRKHHVFSSVPWIRTHGGALAALGHLLSPTIGSLVIPSTYAGDDPHPCGSHWRIDPLLSAENMQIIHDDAKAFRLEKLKFLDREPLVQRHLRVCWENRTVWGNCSRCDKCVLTMIVLASHGQLQHFPGFDRRTPLPVILDMMGPVDVDMRHRYQKLIDKGLPADIESAIVSLLKRDRPPRFSSVRRAVRKFKLAAGRIGGWAGSQSFTRHAPGNTLSSRGA